MQITNRIQITIDSDAGTLSVGTTQLVSRAVDTTGKVMDTVTNYLGSAFNPGTGGTLKSVTKPAALVELAQLIVNEEDIAVNLANRQFALDVDAVAKTAIITTTLPVTESVVNGQPSFIATDYL